MTNGRLTLATVLLAVVSLLGIIFLEATTGQFPDVLSNVAIATITGAFGLQIPNSPKGS